MSSLIMDVFPSNRVLVRLMGGEALVGPTIGATRGTGISISVWPEMTSNNSEDGDAII